MSSIYSLDTTKNLFLYTCQADICLRTSIGQNLTRPVALSQDYASDMTNVIYRDTIYYAYFNTNSDILVKNITDPTILYQKSSQNIPDCFTPKLAVLKQTLLLYYFIKNPVTETYIPKCCLPLDGGKNIDLDNYTFSSLPTLNIIPLAEQLLLLFTDTSLITSLSFSEDFEVTPLIIGNELSDTSANYEKEINELRSFHETQQATLISQHQAELSQTITSFQNSLHQRDQLIESIKAQYAELMSTAIQYREESKKWRQKYIDEKSF